MAIERQDALWAAAAVDADAVAPGFFNVLGSQANQGFAQFAVADPFSSERLAVGVYRMRLQNGIDPAACCIFVTPRGGAAAATDVVSAQVENGDDNDKVVRLSSGANPQVFIDQDFDILVIRVQ
jgi:hypothetical protein